MSGIYVLKQSKLIGRWFGNGLAAVGLMLLTLSLIVFVFCGQRTFVMFWYRLFNI